ncbi:M64 family metallopeptidase [Xenorhabdus sp. IM139775]|uniref:M64 family metallopeptidase n=1 Tax=Xenorhabdus sp. IM139775 TaxID=3025876 RepID=UPI002358A457|nr:M64 family metallopeptidase [Xenorhabdus sp. IM139775]MDC9592186.1 M64 family metallopeptidase [Xenorhabdus sp. IM139775]
MNENKSLWLHLLQENTSSKKNINILNAKAGDFRVPVIPNEDLIPQHKGWRIFTLDKQGNEISHYFVAADDKPRFKTFDPESGQIERIIYKELSHLYLQIVIPYPDNVEAIKIVEIPTLSTPLTMPTSRVFNRKQIETLVKNRCKNKTETSPPISHKVISQEDNTIKRPLILVFMGDGYSQDDQKKWEKDAEEVRRNFFSDPLMSSLKNRFKVIRLDIISKESGISKGSDIKDTAFHMVLGCHNIDRLLCVDPHLVTQTANNVLGHGGYDQILVIGNTSDYGGAGYTGVGTCTMDPRATEIALHEFGHSAYGLADEYDDGGVICSIDGEPRQPNVTIETNRNKIKWRHLIKPETPIPTCEHINGVIGLFEGAQYCTKGKYRPVYISKMRTLGYPWYAVNEEHIRKVMDAYTE